MAGNLFSYFSAFGKRRAFLLVFPPPG